MLYIYMLYIYNIYICHIYIYIHHDHLKSVEESHIMTQQYDGLNFHQNVCIINVVIYIIVVPFADVKQTLVKLYTEIWEVLKPQSGHWMLLVSLGKMTLMIINAVVKLMNEQQT